MTILGRVEKYSVPEPNSGCILWIGAVVTSGYGKMWANGKLCLAHRAVWEQHNGPIPEGMHVCHKCDVKLCVNPHHLFLGTNHENRIDMGLKGRGRKSRRGLPYGVSKTQCGRFMAKVHLDSREHYLGNYTTKEEAHKVALEYKRRMFSERMREGNHE